MGYGYQEYNYESAAPRTFGEMPGLWTKIFGMTTDFFAREAPRASGSVTIINVLLATVIGAIFAVLSSLISMVVYGTNANYGVGFVLGAGCGGFIFGLLGFYVSNGIYYLLARLFGGKGSFGTQTYLVSLFIVPVTLITGVLSLLSAIPCVNIITGLLILGVSIFSLVLYVRVIAASHNLDTGKSIAVILIPMVLMFLLLCCLSVAGILLLGPVMEEIFEEIMWELQNMYLMGMFQIR